MFLESQQSARMNLVHLTSQQTKRRRFRHPLLDSTEDIDAEVLAKQIEFYIATRSKQAKDDLIMGNLILVKWVVGRYLYHWPETRPYDDDMVSEGFTAVTTIVSELDEVVPPHELRAMMVARIKWKIEEWLNNNRSIVRASLRTNWNRLSEGRELEYVNSVPLDENLLPGELDENLTCVDVLDSLDALDAIDKEEFIDVVLLMLERYPQILESEIPDRIRVMIERIIRAIKGTENG